MQTRFRWWRLATLAVAVVLASTLTACAKKATQVPPTTEAPPPQAPAPEKQPETTPTPEPEKIPAPKGITASDLQPVFFDLDSYTLRDDARGALDANAKLLRDNAGTKIVIEGHCDERGTVEYNQALGERRAQAARDYLTRAGIDEGRMQIVSYGKERPFDPGHDEAAWAKNRRAHFALQ